MYTSAYTINFLSTLTTQHFNSKNNTVKSDFVNK